jgi:hypothetical protein
LWHDGSPIPSWAPWAPNFPPKGNKLTPFLRITFVHEDTLKSFWEVDQMSKPLRYICENLVDPEDPVPTEEPPEVTEPEVTTEEPTTLQPTITTEDPCPPFLGIIQSYVNTIKLCITTF